MIVRLGYVAMTMNLENASPSGTVTYANYSKIESEIGRLNKLNRVTEQNLNNTWRILLYNKALKIDVYRLTSKLVPLATHEATLGWEYDKQFSSQFKKIGDYIKENDFRISAHPDHFTLLNTSSNKVLEASIRDLDYHIRVYEAMGLDSRYKLVIHVGGLYNDKVKSIKRFKENFIKLPLRIKERITLENDDKSFSAVDVLEICQELNIPMVFDVHHHKCINNGEKIEDLLPSIFDTWKNEYFSPKIHFSSPKSEKDFRSHADYINSEDFYEFLKAAKKVDRDFDVMLEAKMKDSALFELSKSLEDIYGLHKINTGKFLI